MSETKIYLVGIDGEQTVNSETTLQQIAEVEKLECALVDAETQEPYTWLNLNDAAEPRTLFQSILADRRKRVDEHVLMASRPSFCVVTAVSGRAVRLEFYEGHDALSLVYDVRAAELQSKDLPKFLESDPQAYDPAEFLEQAMGIPRELSEPLLKKLHEDGED